MGAEPRPLDRRVDRRAFLVRVAALTAAGGAGLAAPAPAREGVDLRAIRLPPRGRELPTDPAELTLAEAAGEIREGRLSPVELVDAYLERIRRLDDVYLAFNTVRGEAARARARRLEGAPWRGPLHGIPLALKDNFHTAAVRTTANSYIYQDLVPGEDATAWARLRDAGALLLGKTQMGPLATSRATTPDGENTTVNAWAPADPTVSPSGSSSGSATAVAARLASCATGTQTGGSITGPSGAQGLTGLKPTMGRVSLRGVIPLTYTRDHPGPIARDAMDAAVMLQAMAGPDPGDPRTLGLPPVPDYVEAATVRRRGGAVTFRWPTTVGVLPGYLDVEEEEEEEEEEQREEEPELTPEERRERERRRRRRRLRAPAVAEARRRMLGTLEDLGARVVEVELPEEWETLTSWRLNNVRLPERSEPFLDVLRDDVRKFGVSLSPWINGLLLPAAEYVRGQRAKLLLLRRILDDLLGRCDVVVQTSPIPFDMVGLPLVAFPIDLEEESIGSPRPVAGMLGGLPYAEDRLLSVVAAYQAVTEWHRRRPRDPDGDPPGERMGIDRARPPWGDPTGGAGGARGARAPSPGRGRISLEEVMRTGE